MHKNNYIPNKIKQPAQCCTYCGKSYKLKTNLNKHFTLCELLHKSKRKTYLVIEEDDEMPSQKNMYKMLLEMAQKYNALEEKVSEMNKWIVKKKKQINIVDWLNSNIKPHYSFDYLSEKIIITEDDIQYLLNNTFYDLINELFSKTLYHMNSTNTKNTSENHTYPMFTLVQKPNIFYIYDTITTTSSLNNNNNNNNWQECSREKLVKFLNIIHLKISKYFYNWKKNKINEINQDDNFATLCDKTLIKLMNIDFKQESILNKIKGQMYNKMKTDMTMIVEYEYEF